MIKKIFVSEIDRSNLSRLKIVEEKQSDDFDYSNIVVTKPWGYEYLLFQNKHVAIWILHLEKGQENSLHCHPRKKTSLIVLSGRVQISTLKEWFELNRLDGVIYEEGVFHTQKALSDNVFLMEIETPPNKSDLVRLKDAYGRAGTGYEGLDKMSKDLRRYNHVFFDKKDARSGCRKKLQNMAVSMQWCTAQSALKARPGESKTFCVLEGPSIEEPYKDTFSIGNIFDAEHLNTCEARDIFNKCLILTIEAHG